MRYLLGPWQETSISTELLFDMAARVVYDSAQMHVVWCCQPDMISDDVARIGRYGHYLYALYKFFIYFPTKES